MTVERQLKVICRMNPLDARPGFASPSVGGVVEHLNLDQSVGCGPSRGCSLPPEYVAVMVVSPSLLGLLAYMEAKRRTDNSQ